MSKIKPQISSNKKKKNPTTNSVSQEKGKSTDDNPERTQMLELSGKKIKVATTNYA